MSNPNSYILSHIAFRKFCLSILRLPGIDPVVSTMHRKDLINIFRRNLDLLNEEEGKTKPLGTVRSS